MFKKIILIICWPVLLARLIKELEKDIKARQYFEKEWLVWEKQNCQGGKL